MLPVGVGGAERHQEPHWFWRSHRQATDTEKGSGGACSPSTVITATQLTAKLRDPRAGERPFRRDCHPNLTRGQTAWEFLRAAANRGQGLHMGDLRQAARGVGGNCSRLRTRGQQAAAGCWTDAQEAAPSVSPAPQSVARGEDPGGSRGSRDGGLKARLWRLDQQKECPPHPSDETTLNPKWGR